MVGGITLGALISDFVAAHYPRPEVAPVAMLHFLMEQNQLTQSSLPELDTLFSFVRGSPPPAQPSGQ